MAPPESLALQHPVQIRGSERFISDVQRVLSELQEFAPERYEQVITLMPRIELRPDRLADYTDPAGYGRMQRDSAAYGKEYWEAYRRWKWDFLHEAGHLAAGRLRGDWRDEKANRWANMVMAEIDAAWYRAHW